MVATDIIKAMDAHAKEFGLKVTTIGQAAAQNRKAYERAQSGTLTFNTAERILAWIEQDRKRRKEAVK